MTKKRTQNMKLSDIIPLINEQGMTLKAIAKRYRRTIGTVQKWVKRLRLAGYEIKTRKRGGSKQIPL